MSEYSQAFDTWYKRIIHVPHLEPWQEALVKALAYKAYKKGEVSDE